MCVRGGEKVDTKHSGYPSNEYILEILLAEHIFFIICKPMGSH